MECSKGCTPPGMWCAICLDKCITYIKLKCNHIFHLQCIKKWTKESNKCPLCRKFMGYYNNDGSNNSLIPSFKDLYPLYIRSTNKS
jgi:hypothetical protein